MSMFHYVFEFKKTICPKSVPEVSGGVWDHPRPILDPFWTKQKTLKSIPHSYPLMGAVILLMCLSLSLLYHRPYDAMSVKHLHPSEGTLHRILDSWAS